jgi:UDP-glucuronate 4-epimerase
MIEVLEHALHKKIKVVNFPLQAGDVELTFAKINKAKEMIGYNPQWDFEDGIKAFYKWKMQYDNL